MGTVESKCKSDVESICSILENEARLQPALADLYRELEKTFRYPPSVEGFEETTPATSYSRAIARVRELMKSHPMETVLQAIDLYLDKDKRK